MTAANRHLDIAVVIDNSVLGDDGFRRALASQLVEMLAVLPDQMTLRLFIAEPTRTTHHWWRSTRPADQEDFRSKVHAAPLRSEQVDLPRALQAVAGYGPKPHSAAYLLVLSQQPEVPTAAIVPDRILGWPVITEEGGERSFETTKWAKSLPEVAATGGAAAPSVGAHGGSGFSWGPVFGGLAGVGAMVGAVGFVIQRRRRLALESVSGLSTEGSLVERATPARGPMAAAPAEEPDMGATEAMAVVPGAASQSLSGGDTMLEKSPVKRVTAEPTQAMPAQVSIPRSGKKAGTQVPDDDFAHSVDVTGYTTGGVVIRSVRLRDDGSRALITGSGAGAILPLDERNHRGVSGSVVVLVDKDGDRTVIVSEIPPGGFRHRRTGQVLTLNEELQNNQQYEWAHEPDGRYFEIAIK